MLRDVRSSHRCGCQAALSLAVGLLLPAVALAQSLTAGGVTFEAPGGLVKQSGLAAPVVFGWRNAEDTLSVSVVTMSQGGGVEGAAELEAWPGVGRSFIAGFGDANAKAMEGAYGAPCRYEGIPVQRDLERMAMRIQVDTTCATAPEPTVVRSHVFSLVTQHGQVLFRVDGLLAEQERTSAVADALWASARVSPAARVARRPSAADSATAARAAPVTGGAGLHLRDYARIRTEALAGEFVGALLSGFAVGALLTLLFLRVGLRPVPALVAGQAVLTLLRMWGAEADGHWELDPLIAGGTGLIVVLALRKWAHRQWEKAQPRPTVVPTAGPGPQA